MAAGNPSSSTGSPWNRHVPPRRKLGTGRSSLSTICWARTTTTWWIEGLLGRQRELLSAHVPHRGRGRPLTCRGGRHCDGRPGLPNTLSRRLQSGVTATGRSALRGSSRRREHESADSCSRCPPVPGRAAPAVQPGARGAPRTSYSPVPLRLRPRRGGPHSSAYRTVVAAASTRSGRRRGCEEQPRATAGIRTGWRAHPDPAGPGTHGDHRQ